MYLQNKNKVKCNYQGQIKLEDTSICTVYDSQTGSEAS